MMLSSTRPRVLLPLVAFLCCLATTAHAFVSVQNQQPATAPLFAATGELIITATPSSSRVKFLELDSSNFRHPRDRNLTSFIDNLPGIQFAEEGIRRGYPLLEQGIRLDLLSSSVKVSREQLPDIYQLLVEACAVLDFNASNIPELYIQSSSQANAYTLAFQGKDTPPIVVVTSALLDRCTLPELQAIMGHELGHVKCEHGLYFALGQLASTPWRALPFAAQQIDNTLQQWRLAAEYTCDRAALLVAQDVSVVNTALIKLVSGTSNYNIDTDSFVQQCQEYEKLLTSANPLVRASIQQQVRTHPLPVRRVTELQKWSQSQDFQKLLTTGKELN